RAAPQPLADKSAPTPSGQKRVCGSGPGEASLVRDLLDVGADLSAICREPAAKPTASVCQT
ncbi:Unknown protein sequence, partial [Pseudomonas syringae pv. coriandricola]